MFLVWFNNSKLSLLKFTGKVKISRPSWVSKLVSQKTNLTIIMITIMIGKMDMLFPDMYMMNRFMGTCFIGPRATSQLRFILRLGSDSLNTKKIHMK